MGKLYEVLSVLKIKSGVVNKLLTETQHKFAKFDYFQGHTKVLKMIEDNAQNNAIEQAAEEIKHLPTTVHETLEYVLKNWAELEDMYHQRDKTNQIANADIYFRGNVIIPNVSCNQLIGLEDRLKKLRDVLVNMPTLSASSTWEQDYLTGRIGSWRSEPEITTKTEKVTTPVVLYEATEKHPAQVKEVSVDKTVGTFKMVRTCGAAATTQKALVLTIIDELIIETIQARTRANSTEVVTTKMGEILTDLIMYPFIATSRETK